MLTPKFKEDCITWLELSQIIELSARNWWNESEHATYRKLPKYRLKNKKDICIAQEMLSFLEMKSWEYLKIIQENGKW